MEAGRVRESRGESKKASESIGGGKVIPGGRGEIGVGDRAKVAGIKKKWGEGKAEGKEELRVGGKNRREGGGDAERIVGENREEGGGFSG